VTFELATSADRAFEQLEQLPGDRPPPSDLPRVLTLGDCPVSLDLVRPHLGDLQRTRLAETAFSGSSHLIWSAMAILFAVSHLIWSAAAILSAVSHSMWSVSAVLSRCLIQPGRRSPLSVAARSLAAVAVRAAGVDLLGVD
jgi:hypothetical protein